MKTENDMEFDYAKERAIKRLTPYFAWIKYSTDLGSERARWKYAGSPEGKVELKKKFGKNLDEMPKDWGEMKKLFVVEETTVIEDFLKLIRDIYKEIAGASL